MLAPSMHSLESRALLHGLREPLRGIMSRRAARGYSAVGRGVRRAQESFFPLRGQESPNQETIS